ncbi:hypothetical protein ACFVHB_12540 [Kitasatospora sp. NPDC127111]|uniref:hypothetical protein n=1 Tax=Kitasatospora sp. NPDC127111 TaxID=3345363 RepID=UPI0036374051
MASEAEGTPGGEPDDRRHDEWLSPAEVERLWPQISPGCVRSVAQANGVRTEIASAHPLPDAPRYRADDVHAVAALIADGDAEVEPWQRTDTPEGRAAQADLDRLRHEVPLRWMRLPLETPAHPLFLFLALLGVMALVAALGVWILELVEGPVPPAPPGAPDCGTCGR